MVARRRTSSRSASLALHMLGKGLAPVVGVVLNRSSEVHLEPARYYGPRRRSHTGDRRVQDPEAPAEREPLAGVDTRVGVPSEPAPRA